ncbi:MAG: hypothetical protein ACYS22_13695 [Planctomycetota bacterium]|jgi:hypothetical protein
MAEPSAKAPKKAPATKKDELPERIIIRSYPKAVFLYPTAVCALICALLLQFSAVTPHAAGFVFMCVLLFNFVVLSFEFTRNISVIFVMTGLVFVLLGVLLNDRFQIIGLISKLYQSLNFVAAPGFYYGFFGCFVIVLLGIFIDTRFDYWELRGNEVLHHHGFLGDVERFPAQSLKLKKEINDVFEYLLLLSGRLVIFPSGAERAIVLENVPRINVLEELITNKLHALKVTFEQ